MSSLSQSQCSISAVWGWSACAEVPSSYSSGMAIGLQGLLEIDAGTMKSFRSAAVEGRYSSEPMSEAIRLTKYVRVAGVGVRYISKQELSEMILKAGNQPRRVGVPASWIAGKKHIPVHRGAGM